MSSGQVNWLKLQLFIEKIQFEVFFLLPSGEVSKGQAVMGAICEQALSDVVKCRKLRLKVLPYVVFIYSCK